MRNTKLHQAIGRALGIGALAGAASTAFMLGLLPARAQAQDAAADASTSQQPTTTLETNVVTGSRIRRVDLATANPVFVVDRAEIQRTGKLTLGDLIQEAPVVAGAATNAQVNNGGGSGAAGMSLRGLGEQRTLILINGRRLITGDLNAIPAAMVERVEILKDGASAIYGSDAIAGVVNFILRKDYQGLEVSASYGNSDRDDGVRRGVDLVMGHKSENGSLMVGFNYNKTDPVFAKDRKVSAVPQKYIGDGKFEKFGSGVIPTGVYTIPEQLALANGISGCKTFPGGSVKVTRKQDAAGTQVGDFRCYIPSGPDNDTYNFAAAGNLDLVPQERAGLSMAGNYQLGGGVEAFAEAYYQRTRAGWQIAPLPLIGEDDSVTISPNNAYNPFGADLRNFAVRLERIGSRRQSYDVNTMQFTGGLRGQFGEAWQWDASFTYGRWVSDQAKYGYIFKPSLLLALGPTYREGGVLRCGTREAPVPDCVPLDLFGKPVADADLAKAVAKISPILKSRDSASTRMFEANVSNAELFNLPAGPVGIALGASAHRVSGSSTPDFLTLLDPATGRCQMSTDACSAAVAGGYTVKEAYAESVVPVVKDMPFFRVLNLTVGSRHSRYSTFGATTNSKVGIEWRPVDDVLLRGTWAEVFRTPSITDLYSGQRVSYDSITNDPCANYTGGHPLACQNIPATGTWSTDKTQVQTIKGGDKTLQPESGAAFTYGIVYDPSWLEGLSVSVDAWRYVIRNAIASFGTQEILDMCYETGKFCELITRNDRGEISKVVDITRNLGRIDAKGVDVGINYRLPSTDVGNFRLGLDATYFAQFDRQAAAGVSRVKHEAGTYYSPSAGGDGNFARWRALGTLGWNMGDWSASWRVRYIHGFTIPNATGDKGSDSRRIGATTYHNVALGYNVSPIDMRIDVGVDNLFDKQPPLLGVNQAVNANTDVQTFDLVGRYYWARFSKKF